MQARVERGIATKPVLRAALFKPKGQNGATFCVVFKRHAVTLRKNRKDGQACDKHSIWCAAMAAYMSGMSELEEAEKQVRDMVVQAAASLTQQYGEDAEVIATMRAAEFAAAGDVDGLKAWDMIIEYLVALREGKPETIGEALN